MSHAGVSTSISGVNPSIEYPRLYRVFAELWIYMGLAWLSLFFSWNVHMVVEAHKVLKKRRHRHRRLYDVEPQSVEDKYNPDVKRSVIDIFNFLSEKEEDYSTVIKEIGIIARKRKPADNINRSKSCSDILAIQTLDHSPRQRHMVSISEVFMNATADMDKGDQEEERSLIPEGSGELEPAECVRTGNVENKDSCAFDSENDGIIFTVPAKDTTEEQSVQHPDGGETRFTISKVNEDLLMDKDEKG